MARGFPWNVKQTDVAMFFHNVHILGGSCGITIKKNLAMEATFYVQSMDDVRKALAHDKDRIDFRVIHGIRQNLIFTLLKTFFTCLSTKWYFPTYSVPLQEQSQRYASAIQQEKRFQLDLMYLINSKTKAQYIYISKRLLHLD